MGLRVSGKVAPETVKPDPAIPAALTVSDRLPLELSVSDWVAGVFTETFPKLTLEALRVRVGIPGVNCRAKVCATLPALAVRVTVCAEETALTVAVKLALAEPAATVTEAGTVTAELLLASATARPPAAAETFSVAVQLSVPALFMELLAQLSPVSAGTPVPLRPTTVDVPVDELLIRVSEPEAAPAAVGSNCTVSVAD